MKVLVNQITALRQKAGMGHYIAQLVRCLPQEAGEDQILLYPGLCTRLGLAAWKKLCTTLGKFRNKKNSPVNSLPATTSPQNNRDWLISLARWGNACHFRTFWAGRDFDLYHEPNYLPLPCARPTIVTVADLSLLLHPQWHPAERARHFARYFPEGLARSAHVITISEFSRQEIIRNLNIPADRVTSTYMGIRPGLGPLPAEKVQPVLKRLGLPEKYLLYVGTLEPRKNLLLLLQAFNDLPAEVRHSCPLVLVGGWGWNTAELLHYFHDRARHQGVIHLGYTPDADLPALYNGARALVFPSHYEGFGLPPLEMMACGGAVLASTAGAVVETAGTRAHLLDPHDRTAWRQAMQRVIQDEDFRHSLRQGVEAIARPFTWERCAAQTWQVYRQVAGLSPSQATTKRAA